MRPEVGYDDTAVGVMMAAVIEGLVLRRSMSPVVMQPFRCDTFGQGLEWTPAGLILAATIEAMTEPEPDFDEAGVPALQRELREVAGRAGAG